MIYYKVHFRLSHAIPFAQNFQGTKAIKDIVIFVSKKTFMVCNNSNAPYIAGNHSFYYHQSNAESVAVKMPRSLFFVMAFQFPL